MDLPDITDKWLKSAGDIKHVVIFGIESHVCVLQTTLDLLDRGIQVHVIKDGVSSCNVGEIDVALEVSRSMRSIVIPSSYANLASTLLALPTIGSSCDVQRMRDSGAKITTSESVLFQMLGKCSVRHFLCILLGQQTDARLPFFSPIPMNHSRRIPSQVQSHLGSHCKSHQSNECLCRVIRNSHRTLRSYRCRKRRSRTSKMPSTLSVWPNTERAGELLPICVSFSDTMHARQDIQSYMLRLL